MTNYVGLLAEIPTRHSGLLLEQINRAASAATYFLRANGLSLPGTTKIPSQRDVKKYLAQMVNRCLDGYYAARKAAPVAVKNNEVWGEDEDALFSVTVHGLDEDYGFTATIDLNLLYSGDDLDS